MNHWRCPIVLVLIVGCSQATGALVRTLVHGDQVKSIKNSLAAYKTTMSQSPKNVPKMTEFETILYRINGYAGAHNMHLREIYGAQSAAVIRKLKDCITCYRSNVKASTAEKGSPMVAVEMLNDLITEAAQHRNSSRLYAKKVVTSRFLQQGKRHTAELYAQFFDTAIAVMHQIKAIIMQRMKKMS